MGRTSSSKRLEGTIFWHYLDRGLEQKENGVVVSDLQTLVYTRVYHITDINPWFRVLLWKLLQQTAI